MANVAYIDLHGEPYIFRHCRLLNGKPYAVYTYIKAYDLFSSQTFDTLALAVNPNVIKYDLDKRGRWFDMKYTEDGLLDGIHSIRVDGGKPIFPVKRTDKGILMDRAATLHRTIEIYVKSTDPEVARLARLPATVEAPGELRIPLAKKAAKYVYGKQPNGNSYGHNSGTFGLCLLDDIDILEVLYGVERGAAPFDNIIIEDLEELGIQHIVQRMHSANFMVEVITRLGVGFFELKDNTLTIDGSNVVIKMPQPVSADCVQILIG